jgi:hypothetical protein
MYQYGISLDKNSFDTSGVLNVLLLTFGVPMETSVSAMKCLNMGDVKFSLVLRFYLQFVKVFSCL